MNGPEQDTRSSLGASHLEWIEGARQEFEEARERSAALTVRASVDSDSITAALIESLPGYTIGREISRGGQGVVFKSVQRATRRDVAIKVLREGPMAQAQDLARFEREVQILGQFKHPNIVTILDSGSSGGHFYYIMDYVHGSSLDDHVRRSALSVRDILELFAKICDAVNVAHLRGVIHRDIKPGNIRVDPAGEPHVMDFGLAKVGEFDPIATGSSGPNTVTGQFIGSVPWASPEQIEGLPEKIDVRTDIYSLGVMLYQVLTGAFPYVVVGNIRDVLNNVCTAEPRKPSELNRQIDDEVEQILLKCLCKERELRYQTGGELAREIRRYLAGEPIDAKRDSTWYVLRKAVRRHRVRAGFVAMFGLLILTTGIALAVLYRQESRLRGEAEAARLDAEDARREMEKARDTAIEQAKIASAVNDFLQEGILAAVAPDALGREATIHEAIDAASKNLEASFEDQPMIRAQLHFTLGEAYFGLGDTALSEEHCRQSYEIYRKALGAAHASTLYAQNNLGRFYAATGKLDEAEEMFRRCLELRSHTLGPDGRETLIVQSNLGWLLMQKGAHAEAEELCREAYEGHLRVMGPAHEETISSLNNLAALYVQLARYDEAEPLLLKLMDLCKRVYGEESTGTLTAMVNLASFYAERGRLEEADSLSFKALELRRRMLGNAHPSTLMAMNNLAVYRSKMERIDSTEELLAEALKLGREAHGDAHPTVITLFSNLGWVYNEQSRFEEGLLLHEAAVAGGKGYLPPDHEYIGLYEIRLGRCLTGLRRFENAEAALTRGHDILRAKSGNAGYQTRNAKASLVDLYGAWGKPAESARWKSSLEDAMEEAAQ